MFAVKQSVRCLSRRLQFNLVPKVRVNCPSTVSGIFIKPQIPTVSHTSLRLSSNVATGVAKNQKEDLSISSNVAELQAAEPDVLYHKVEIELRSSEPAVLKSYEEFISLAAQYLELNLEHSQPEKKYQVRRWTVLKSRHVHRKHMVTYEVRTYHKLMQVNRVTGSTADTFLEYIQRNLPEGVSMRVGRVRMEKIPDHLLTPPSPSN